VSLREVLPEVKLILIAVNNHKREGKELTYCPLKIDNCQVKISTTSFFSRSAVRNVVMSLMNHVYCQMKTKLGTSNVQLGKQQVETSAFVCALY